MWIHVVCGREQLCGVINTVIMSHLNESRVISLLAEQILLVAEAGLLSVEPLSCLQTRHSSLAQLGSKKHVAQLGAVGNTWHSLAVGNTWRSLAQ